MWVNCMKLRCKVCNDFQSESIRIETISSSVYFLKITALIHRGSKVSWTLATEETFIEYWKAPSVDIFLKILSVPRVKVFPATDLLLICLIEFLRPISRTIFTRNISDGEESRYLHWCIPFYHGKIFSNFPHGINTITFSSIASATGEKRKSEASLTWREFPHRLALHPLYFL